MGEQGPQPQLTVQPTSATRRNAAAAAGAIHATTKALTRERLVATVQ
jgi:hypothetical protein